MGTAYFPGDFLDRGMLRLQAHDGEGVTPLPTVDTLDDGSVFVSSQVASRLGVRPPAAVRFYEENATRPNRGEKGDLRVLRLDPYVESGEWEIQADENGSILVSESISGDEFPWDPTQGPFDLGFGYPVFEITGKEVSLDPGERILFHRQSLDYRGVFPEYDREGQGR